MRRIWFDLGELGLFLKARPEITSTWQDHGLGLLRTIMHRAGVASDVASLRNMASWEEVADIVKGYDMLLMNIRSYTFVQPRQVATIFKKINPKGMVLVGGMHATVALEEMIDDANFDHICQGAGEQTIVDLTTNPGAFPRVIVGQGAKKMGDWPLIDRTLWPVPKCKPTGKPSVFGKIGLGISRLLRVDYPHPLEPAMRQWGASPMASIMTSRVCPWRCAFCNESTYIPNLERKPVEQVVEELNWLDKRYGPIGSVVIHDFMFFQQPAWLEEWAEVYPRRARKLWPYWAAARADTVRRWPDLFLRVVKQTNWQTISLGLESGSDRTLKTLNKECTAHDNLFAVLMVNQLGRDLRAQGRKAPRLFTNLIVGVPGETREDVMDTLRMVSCIRRPLLSFAYYAPFPGSALGYQIIAEGKSLMAEGHHMRTAGIRYVSGVDYAFLYAAIRGLYSAKAWLTRKDWIRRVTDGTPPMEPLTSFHVAQHIYLFALKSGKTRLSYGVDEADALGTLKLRLTAKELDEIETGSPQQVHQNMIHDIKHTLG
jgi:radical SAM superfamily enzyme YgiQ (UPF0313 family)